MVQRGAGGPDVDYDTAGAVSLETFDDLSGYDVSETNQFEKYATGGGKRLTKDGPVQDGVSQTFVSSADAPRAGPAGVVPGADEAADGDGEGEGGETETAGGETDGERAAAEVEALARTVPDAGGCVFVPALAGLGAPYWDPDARGALLGVSRGTNRGHVARAVLEGVAFQIVDLARAMEADAGRTLADLRVDGGATANDLLMQRQADVLGVPVHRPRMVETTSLGSALLAGLAVGFWSDLAALREAIAVEKIFSPGLGEADRERELRAWRAAVAAVRTMARGGEGNNHR